MADTFRCIRDCGRMTYNLGRICVGCLGGPIFRAPPTGIKGEKKKKPAGRPVGKKPLGEGAGIKVCHDPSKELGLV